MMQLGLPDELSFELELQAANILQNVLQDMTVSTSDGAWIATIA